MGGKDARPSHKVLTQHLALLHTVAMQDSPPDPFVTTSEATGILGYANPSSVARLVYEGKLTPARKLPGVRGAYLFSRSDVEALAAERAAS